MDKLVTVTTSAAGLAVVALAGALVTGATVDRGAAPSTTAAATSSPTSSSPSAAGAPSDPAPSTTPPAPVGVNAVSDLPFLSATNGWGPVERDRSVGGNNPDDGVPLSIDGVTYPKGLGVNAVSDVALFLGGRCTRLTADVGVDGEVGVSGTVTFTVTGDDRTLAATPVLQGGQPAQLVAVDVTGVSVLHLVVGDAGDGNADDHADWASPTLTCAG